MKRLERIKLNSDPVLHATSRQAAEAVALEATKKFGVGSQEARLAWDEYEEIAAADNSIATRATLDEDCDVSPSRR